MPLESAPRALRRPWGEPRFAVLALTVILLLAFGLRVYRLDGQSLWADEGASVVMTYRSPAAILEAAAGDIHPPLYYLALRGWAELAGRTEYALRFLSVLAGVAVVALTAVVGRLLLGPAAALLGTFFAAVSPLLIYYSQETRMYEQMALLGMAAIAGSLLWWRRWDRGRPSALLPLLLVLAFAGAVLTQFFGVTAMVGATLAFVALHPSPLRWWRRWLAWAAVQGGAIVLVIPWLLYASNQLRSWEVTAERLSPLAFAERVFRFFAYGPAWDQTVTGKTIALGIALLVLAAAWSIAGPGKARRAQAVAAVVLLAVAAPLTLFGVALNRPVVPHPKFLLISVPAFCLLQGAGVAAAGAIAQRMAGRLARAQRRLPLAVGTLVVVALVGGQEYAAGRALLASYHDPKYFRDDYRGLVRYLALTSQPGDVIVLNAPGQREIFDYYYRDQLPVIGLPTQRPPDDARTVAELEQLIATARRIWLVLWASEQADPNGVVEGWLNEHAFRAYNRWYGGVRLVQYVVPIQTEAGTIQFPERVQFERGIELLGYSLAQSESRPGEALQLTLFWRATAPVDERYTVFTHLIDAAELIWGQRDAEPGSGRRPTDSWTPGETIVDRYGLPVFAGTPPGAYYIEIGLYRASDGRRLGILENGRVIADRVLLGMVTITRPERQPTVEQLFIEHPRDVPYGPLRLLGYDFHKLGFDRGATDFSSGDLAHLTLYWRAESRPTSDPPLRIEVRNDAGNSVRTVIAPVTNGLAPLTTWQVGDIVRDQHKFALDVLPGRYRLFAGLDGEPLIELGPLTVR
ncbi:MAG: glycosyltransferase family 39 protein [Chloroflexota bacterium]|nr:glycosyltransferase family 39 protein [Dehalococcoidia bacterium]MDW8255241.1 glycosyltransferase family 39 protein [Chloroflexota bacterium]